MALARYSGFGQREHSQMSKEKSSNLSCTPDKIGRHTEVGCGGLYSFEICTSDPSCTWGGNKKGSFAFGLLKSLMVNLFILLTLWVGTFFRKSRFLLLYFKKENRDSIKRNFQKSYSIFHIPLYLYSFCFIL